jgi:hypothetical protein
VKYLLEKRPDPNAAKVDDMFRLHIQRSFAGETIAELQRQFKERSMVPLRGFCPPELYDALKAEVFRLIDTHGVARDMVLEITDNTPRHMTTVGQPVIKREGDIIPAVYDSPALGDVLSRIVGERVFQCPYAGEHYVISRLKKSGDTHGWHWDDYSYGFVLIVEAPDYRDGGFVQCVPNTSWDKRNPDVHAALLESQVHSYAFSAGDAYLLRTDTTMHRVFPIRGNGRRTIVNMTWANADNLARPLTHETNDILFGGGAPQPRSPV